MNPRQWKGLGLLALTALGGVAVFIGVLLYVNSISSQVGPRTTVLEISEAVEPLEPLTSSMVEEVEIPERWVPEGAIRSIEETEGLVTAGGYQPGTMLQEGMLTPPPGLQPGYREVAIMVDAETGVAGKVGPGDRVDIIATLGGDENTPPRAEVWVTDALVLEVGVPTEVEEEDATGGFTSSQGLPVTFALSSEEALRLAYGESFAVKLRLALRGAGDVEEIPDGERTYTEGGQ